MKASKIYILILYCCLRSLAQNCPQDPTVVELIKNGAFELANNASNGLFESDYPGPKTSVQPDSWGIGKDPSDLDNGFASLKDHTTGNGNMMVIDADGTLGKDAYRTLVNVTANTTYFFSAWFVNVGSTTKAAPVLRFTVGSTVVGASINVSATSRQWQQFYGTWFSGATSGPVTIRIENMVPTTDGNDLAIDDISFSSSCTKIQDISKYGKSSVLPDSLYLCEINLPINLNPGLSAAAHTFNWAAPSTSATTPTFDISTVPNYSKLVMCYDSIDDGITCYKKDSVVIVKDLRVKLGPDREVCEPIGESFTATPNIAGAAYSWQRNAATVGGNSTTYSTTQEGTYKVTVTKTGCTPASDEVVVAKIPAPLSYKGLYCNTASPEEGFFTLNGANRINNALNIKWFNDAVAGTEISTTRLNDSTIKVTSGTYASIPNCARALWAQDMNAFKTTLTQNLNPADEAKKSSSDIRQKIVVRSAKLTLDSLSFYIDNNSSSAGTTPYQITVYVGNTNNNTLGSVVFTSPIYNFNKVPDPVLKTVPLGLTLDGSATGLYYWILITGEIGYYDNVPSFPHNNTGTPTVLSVVETFRENQTRANEIGFIQNIKATAGKTSTCGRVLVCADVLNCTLPIHFTSFTVQKDQTGIHFAWAFAQLGEIQSLVQMSIDGVEFEDLSAAQAHTYFSAQSLVHSEYSTLYFRIKGIDSKGQIYYSQLRSLHIQQDDINVFPNPSTSDFTVLSSLTGQYEVLSLNGQIIENGDFENNFRTKSQLIPGLYLLKINTLESNYTFKIIKK